MIMTQEEILYTSKKVCFCLVDDVTSKLKNHDYNMKLNMTCIKMRNKWET